MELFLDAVGVCLGTTIVKIMEKPRLNVRSYAIDVHGDRTAQMPHPSTHVVVTHRFRGPSLNRGSLERVDALVDEKYCSVAAILPRGFTENGVRIEESTVAEHSRSAASANTAHRPSLQKAPPASASPRGPCDTLPSTATTAR
jgi:uncharacterized OsmC-like protein